MSNDPELLRRYVGESSESAFSELVQEHLNLVYSAALRETSGDGALAEDVSQAVFTELARKAPRLLGHPSLAGWLYTTVRHLAANLRRAEQHRRRREEEAQVMNELLGEDSPNEVWQRLRPELDDVLHELKEADRAVVVLRFLENRTLREVGDRLGLTENAARMRVDRALEKLRGQFARRGITSTAASLTAALAIGVITPAPATLAATISSTAIASGAVISSTSLYLLKFMSLSKAQVSIAALVVAGIAAPVWQQTRLNRVESENAQWRAQAVEPGRARGEVEPPPPARATPADQAELERLRQWRAQTEPELLRLRGMAGLARRANAEAEEMRKQLAQKASETGANPVSGAMADAMGQAMQQQAEGRLSRMTASLHLTSDQAKGVREILMRQAQVMSKGMQQAFSGKYDKDELTRMAKEGGNPETQMKALLTPDQKAAYQTYEKEEAAHTAGIAANTELVQLQSTLDLTAEQLDRVYAALYEVSFNQMTGVTKPSATDQAEVMQWALDQKAKAMESVLTPAQLEKYSKQQAAQAKLIKDIIGKMQASGRAK